jgi:hypothetical protein
MSDTKSAEINVGEKLDESITRLADQARTKQNGTEAMQFSQAALNLAHTKSILLNTELQGKLAESKPSEAKAEATTARK